MKNVKRISAALLALLVGCASFGCSSKSTASSSGTAVASQKASASTSNSSIKIAVVLENLSNPYWSNMKKAVIAEGEKEGVQVDVFAPSSSTDMNEQLKLLEDAIQKDYQGIGLAPLSPVSLIPGVLKANEKNLPVVDIDEEVDKTQLMKSNGKMVGYVATDNVAAGKTAADYIIKQVNGGGEVAIIEGTAGEIAGEDRKKGATAEFATVPGIKLVASQPADWDRTKALNVASNLIQSHPNLKYIYAANDNMALGVYQAIKQAGKAGKINVVGTDGLDEAKKSVDSGEMSATVVQETGQIGAKAISILTQAIKDKNTGKPDFPVSRIQATLYTKK